MLTARGLKWAFAGTCTNKEKRIVRPNVEFRVKQSGDLTKQIGVIMRRLHSGLKFVDKFISLIHIHPSY
jgi:hypothetical protein